MENESNEIYAAFGLDAPADETAAPDETVGDPGTGPEDSKPAEDTAADETPQTGEETTDTEDSDAQETDEADEPVQKVQPAQPPVDTSAVDANYAAAFMGRKNPYTGRPIMSKADFDEYKRMQAEEAAKAEQQAADEEAARLGFTPEQIEAVFLKSENGKKMQAALDYIQRQAEQTNREAIQKLIDADIAEIGKYDPSVKDVDSLKKTARGDAIAKRVASGRYTWKEAWMLENFDAMQKAHSDAATQAAFNNANSKNHLQSTAQRGTGEADVPRDVRAIYEAMGINDKDEQRKSYGEYMSLFKKG